MADKILRETVMKDDKGNETKVYIGVNPNKYGRNSLRIGENNTAIEGSVANGYGCHATGTNSHAEGNETTASGFRSHAEGDATLALGTASHAEGEHTAANGDKSHAEGFSTYSVKNVITNFSSTTTSDAIITAWTDKKFSLANGKSSHVEGNNCLALGEASHAEGYDTIANGDYSHAEGYNTTANGDYSHAEGIHTLANGGYSHAEGYGTIAQGSSQFVAGRFNNPNVSDLFQIGCGRGSKSKQNAFSIDNEGKAHIYKGLILEDIDISSNNSVLKLNPSNGEDIIIGNNSLVVNNATGSNRGHISIYDNIYFNNLETPTILGMYDTSFSLPAFPETITIKANYNIDAYGDFSSAFNIAYNGV